MGAIFTGGVSAPTNTTGYNAGTGSYNFATHGQGMPNFTANQAGQGQTLNLAQTGMSPTPPQANTDFMSQYMKMYGNTAANQAAPTANNSTAAVAAPLTAAPNAAGWNQITSGANKGDYERLEQNGAENEIYNPGTSQYEGVGTSKTNPENTGWTTAGTQQFRTWGGPGGFETYSG